MSFLFISIYIFLIMLPVFLLVGMAILALELMARAGEEKESGEI